MQSSQLSGTRNSGRTVTFAEDNHYYFDGDDDHDHSGYGGYGLSGGGSGLDDNGEEQIVVEEDDFQGHESNENLEEWMEPQGNIEQQQQQLQSAQQQLEQEQQQRREARASLFGGSSSLICPNCGSRDIEQHDASGASVCIECGVVVEENAIVSSVEFVEGAGGASNMVGRFVSANSSKAYTMGGGRGGGRGGGGGRFGFSRESRENTLANGRRRIQDVASRLRIGTHFVDAAHRLYTIAVEQNFVKGRRTTHVVAACLYMACRLEKSQHMLIDFSDALQVNVYTLGTTFLKFRRMLGLKLDIVDPALYIYRFTAHLALEEKANVVAMTALRLVARMKRDWIVAGRRPAGICAAALLIASRAHGFSRHHSAVTRILRVCGFTVQARVREFEQTAAAQLTLDQFHSNELEAEADPPVFRKNKIREARAKAIIQGNQALLTSGLLEDPYRKRRSTSNGMDRPLPAKQQRFQEMYEALQEELQHGTGRHGDAGALGADLDNCEDDLDGENDSGKRQAVDNHVDEEMAKHQSNHQNATEFETTGTATLVNERQLVPASRRGYELVTEEVVGNVDDDDESMKKRGFDEDEDVLPPLSGGEIPADYPRDSRGRALVLPNQVTAEERQESVIPVQGKISLANWKADLPESIDAEIEDIFRSEEEEKQKEAMFVRMNKDYLDIQERKEEERRNAESQSQNLADLDAAQQSSHAQYKKRGRKRKGESGGAVDTSHMTTEEQLMAAVANRKISRKINYDALSSIFGDDGSFATQVSGGDEDGMLAGDF